MYYFFSSSPHKFVLKAKKKKRKSDRKKQGGWQDSQEIKTQARVACGEREADDGEKGIENMKRREAQIKTTCRLNLQYCSQLKPAGRSIKINIPPIATSYTGLLVIKV